MADAAQVVNGKLYLLGGGWSMLAIGGEFPASQRIAVAASFLVGWNETNMPHAAEIEILSDDGRALAKVEGRFEVGRPAGVPPGQPQRVQFAADMVLTFEGAGSFVAIARIDGQEGRRVPFTIIAAGQIGPHR